MGPILHPHLPYTLERHYSAGIDTLLNPIYLINFQSMLPYNPSIGN